MDPMTIPEAQPLHAELEAVRQARQSTKDAMEIIRLRNRQGELTQQLWRLYWDRQRRFQ